jgi:hypothetical protein
MVSWSVIENAAQLATVLAFLLTLNGLRRERRERKNLERKAQILVWSDIAKLRGLMTDLEKNVGEDGLDFGKHQAVGKLTSMYRDKIRQVYELSPTIAPSDVQAWRKSGKIASNWQEACFWEAFPQDSLKAHDITEPSLFSSLDELPDTHSMAAKPKQDC